jgi:hypothetical protein
MLLFTGLKLMMKPFGPSPWTMLHIFTTTLQMPNLESPPSKSFPEPRAIALPFDWPTHGDALSMFLSPA